MPARRLALALRSGIPVRCLAALVPALVAGGCRPEPAAPAPPTPEPAVRAPEPPTPEPPPPVDCGDAIEGADALLRSGGLVMLGEMHGTRQIPAFVGDLVCMGATRGLAVRLGVELPRSETQAIETYLAAGANAGARDALLSSHHWTRGDQDGRSSEAVFALIERVRTLREAGLDVVLFPFDVEATSDWNARDADMAARILERASTEPDALVLTLSGNVHNRTKPGLPWNARAIPMGVHIHRARGDAISLDARYQRGTAWVCRSETECGVTELGGSAGSSGRRIEVQAEPDANGYHGTFTVGPIEAAPPAVHPTDDSGAP